MKHVCVVGLGYIGLPTAILAAQHGYQVLGFDVDSEKVKKINEGDPTILEPGIVQNLYQVLNNKKFYASNVLSDADCFLIAVPTPFKKEEKIDQIKKADLSYVFDACKKISKVLRPGNLVILESTVPVGTTAKMAKFLEQESGLKLGLDFFVAHCPERVLPGKIFQELVNNDRVIGGVCQKSGQLSKDFYSKFVKGLLYLTDDKSAEMVKLVENSSRDVQIAFANQVEAMCMQAGIDANSVIKLANRHPRVNILSPTCGVGGHCIAVDPWFLIESFPKQSQLLQTARVINNQKPLDVIDIILKKVEILKEKNVVRPKVFILGLTFKPDVDDMRESPALKIAQELKTNKNIEIAVCEPNVEKESLFNLGFDNYKELSEGAFWADIIVILVKHTTFFALRSLTVDQKIIVDTCGLMREVNKGDLFLVDSAVKSDQLEN